jgi:hypothetical protein
MRKEKKKKLKGQNKKIVLLSEILNWDLCRILHSTQGKCCDWVKTTRQDRMLS